MDVMRNLWGVLISLTLGGYAAGATPAQAPSRPPASQEESAQDGGTTQSDADIDKALIRSVIAAHREELRECYERALEQVPQLRGKVAVRFVINPDGSVTAPSIVESSVGNREFEQCIFKKLMTWRFARTSTWGTVVVTYPFFFKPQTEPDAGVSDAGVPDAGT